MTDFGQTVHRLIGTLSQFHRDVSRLFVCVEEQVTRRAMVPLLADATAMWDRSWSYRNPDGWIPRYVCRMYVAASSDGKKAKLHRAGAFFGVYFTPEPTNEPVAVWGVARCPEPVDLFWLLKPVLLRDRGPSLPIAERPVDWTEAKTAGYEVTYRAEPLIQLADAAKVEAAVVDLLSQFSRPWPMESK